MANKYDKDVFEEIFSHQPGTFPYRYGYVPGRKNRRRGLPEKTDRLYRHRIYTHRVQIQV